MDGAHKGHAEEITLIHRTFGVSDASVIRGVLITRLTPSLPDGGQIAGSQLVEWLEQCCCTLIRLAKVSERTQI